jgi:hypothetical protein
MGFGWPFSIWTMLTSSLDNDSSYDQIGVAGGLTRSDLFYQCRPIPSAVHQLLREPRGHNRYHPEKLSMITSFSIESQERCFTSFREEEGEDTVIREFYAAPPYSPSVLGLLPFKLPLPQTKKQIFFLTEYTTKWYKTNIKTLSKLKQFLKA